MRLISVRALAFLLIAPALVSAQVPRIGILDFYGLHNITQETIRKAAGLSEGDPLPASKADVEDRLEHLPGIVLARLEAVCCAHDRAILYIGIEERNAPHFEFREPPTGTVTLPAGVADRYREFIRAFAEAARKGEGGENLSRGHALAINGTARAQQEQFLQLADENVETLRQVLRESEDPEQRAIAAYVIGYVRDKQSVVNDLQFAMQDADESVRANAIRSLGAIASLAVRQPKLGLRVQPTWFVEILNSIVWSDRYHAANALVSITEGRDSRVLAELRERARPALIEMARWKTLAHALPAFILAGRVAGVPEAQIHEAWSRGDRESILRRLARLQK